LASLSINYGAGGVIVSSLTPLEDSSFTIRRCLLGVLYPFENVLGLGELDIVNLDGLELFPSGELGFEPSLQGKGECVASCYCSPFASDRTYL
jgi:hypothetical protein